MTQEPKSDHKVEDWSVDFESNPDSWTLEKLAALDKAAREHHLKRTPERIARNKELSEKYRKENE